MSLQLDPRQRAMLRDMGITVWMPAPKAAPPLEHSEATIAARPATRTDKVVAPARAAHASTVAPSALPQMPAAPATVHAAPDAVLLSTPQVLYPQQPADGDNLKLTTAAPLSAQKDGQQACWLIITESTTPHQQPLSGDAGQLLDNMLRAMRLHHHPRVFISSVAGAYRAFNHAAPATTTVAHVLKTLHPAVVLALGLGAARSILGGSEPLGRLRDSTHRLPDGTPVVVSYNPAYLLRTPDAKRLAWDDLCRALEAAARSSESQHTP